MRTIAEPVGVKFSNILYLTDFSEPSEAALPFVVAASRGYGAKVYALNVMIPAAYVYSTPEVTAVALEAEEEAAQSNMKRVESQLAGLPHATIVERGTGVWEPVKSAIAEYNVDLIVLGSHGRTGTQKFFLGSVAEEIFRRSPVPVLTIGPAVRGGSHNGARFHRVLLATDFAPGAEAAVPYAISLAQNANGRLILVHVIRKFGSRNGEEAAPAQLSVAEAIHQLYELPPKDAGLEFPPEVAVEFGEPADRIVEAAKVRGADIIILGLRDVAGHVGAATHLGGATAHKVVVHAPCPVLTVPERFVAPTDLS
jgi:nucleotide-binding universal stress UspA family protein